MLKEFMIDGKKKRDKTKREMRGRGKRESGRVNQTRRDEKSEQST